MGLLTHLRTAALLGVVFVAGLALIVGSGGGGGGDSPAPTEVPPSIVTQPLAQSVVAPTAASFTVVASGTPTPSYQWQRSTDLGVTFSDIPAATSATYTTPSTTVAETGQRFRVRVSNSAGSVESAVVALTVTAIGAPTFSAQPTDQSVTAPATATFAVTATGTPPPSLQWKVSVDGGASFTNIPGANGSSYTTPSTSATDNGTLFQVVATNSAGTTVSTAARLTVQPSPNGQAFAYTISRSPSAIAGYSVNRATGAVTPTPGSPYSVSASATAFLVLHPNGRFLYAAEITGQRTWIYAIDPTDGRLTLAPGSPVTAALSVTAPPVIDPSGRYIVYTTGFQLWAFAIDAGTGGLTSIGTATISINGPALLPFVQFSQDGQFFVVQESTGPNLRVFRTNPVTLLTAAGTSVPAIATRPFYVRGAYLLVQRPGTGANTGLTSHAIGDTGTLTPIQSLTGLGANFVAHPNGRCFYMSGPVSGNLPNQSVTFTPVSLNPSTGALSANQPVRVPVPGQIVRSEYPLLPSPGGTSGYLTDPVFSINTPVTPVSLNGDACTIAAGAPFDPTPLGAVRFALDSTDSLLFGSSATAASIVVARVDPVTRVPSPVAGSPFATAGPTALVPYQLIVRD